MLNADRLNIPFAGGRRPSVSFTRHSARTARRWSRAFTFVEVLFAIIILGVGMIMIAGMLPVAIKQNSDTRDELTGRAVCDSGYAYVLTAIQSSPQTFVSTQSTDPNAGDVVPLNYKVVTSTPAPSVTPPATGTNKALNELPGLSASRICTSDPRFQWLAFYRRDPSSSYIRLVILSMRLHNGEVVDRYSAGGTLSKEDDNKGNGPYRVSVNIIEGTDASTGTADPDRIVFDGNNNFGANRDNWDVQVAAPGAFVVIANSPSPTADPTRGKRNNGRVFRLAAQRFDLDASGRTWDLASGYDLEPADAGPDGINGTADDTPDGSMNKNGKYYVGAVGSSKRTPVSGGAATAWIVGRGRLDPTAAATVEAFGGPAQDVSVLQTAVIVQ